MKYSPESYMGEAEPADHPWAAPKPEPEEPAKAPSTGKAPNPLDGISRPADWKGEALAGAQSISKAFAKLPRRDPLWTYETNFDRQRIAARVAMEAVRTNRNPEQAVASALLAFEAAKLIEDVPEHDEEF